MKRLVLLGGGHSHVEVLRRFGTAPLPQSELVLASPYSDSPYSGMLPGWIAGHYSRDECHIDLRALARLARCRFVLSACNRLDPDARVVSCEDGTTLSYDFVSVDAGAVSPAPETPGAGLHALALKPVELFIPRWDEMREQTARDLGPRSIAMVGGGAAGVEVLLAMQHRLRKIAPMTDIRFELVGDADIILPGHNAKVRAIFMRVLERRGVTLHLGCAVERVQRDSVRLRGGASVGADAIIWATGPAAPSWPKAAGVATDDQGFILVDECLRSVSHSDVFASGDIASIKAHPRPKSGVYAVRAGPPLATNLRRALAGDRLVGWTPQKDALALISTGDRFAVASRGSLALEGKWVWRWKDWIDRRFVERYRMP